MFFNDVYDYGYIRVSTDKQTTENQRFEILKFAHEKKLSIGRWIEETVSSTRKLSDRKLGALLERMHEDDLLIVTELSRLGKPFRGDEPPAPLMEKDDEGLYHQRALRTGE